VQNILLLRCSETPAAHLNHRLKEQIMQPLVSLEGKVGLITGIANEKSISTGVAEACVDAGAKLIVTYQNEKTKAFIEPIVNRLGVEDVCLMDVTRSETMDEAFAMIDAKYGKLDFALHSMAFAKREDLHGRGALSARRGAWPVLCRNRPRRQGAADAYLCPCQGARAGARYRGRRLVARH
jgi:hypothetical protein